MNKLSSCKLFEMVDKTFKGSIYSILKLISESIDKYTVETQYYDFMVKSMRSYKYPLTKFIVKSALTGEIRPLLLIEPKDTKEKAIFLPSAIPSFSTTDNKFGYVDISPRASYTRDNAGRIDSLKIKEIDLYAFLNIAFNELYLKKFSENIDKSSNINKNIAIAYSRLLTRCIDRTYPVSANTNTLNLSIFLTSIFPLVQFFNYSVEDAISFVFSTKISNKVEIEAECKLLKEGKLQFTNIEEFLKLYNYEFSDYMKPNSLSLRVIVNLFQRMYGANSWFALEHAGSFFNMILSVQIGLFNDKAINKTIKSQIDNINAALVSIFSMKQ